MEMDSWPLLAKCRGLQDDMFPDGADQKRAENAGRHNRQLMSHRVILATGPNIRPYSRASNFSGSSPSISQLRRMCSGNGAVTSILAPSMTGCGMTRRRACRCSLAEAR